MTKLEKSWRKNKSHEMAMTHPCQQEYNLVNLMWWLIGIGGKQITTPWNLKESLID